MTDRVEADAVGEFARDAITAGQTPVLGSREQGWATVYVPGEGFSTVDESKRNPVPSRPTGEITVYDADGFMAALAQRKLDGRPNVAYADDDHKVLVAVLDDDTLATAGWRDYRVTLVQRRTPEWQAWLADSGKNMEQRAFAEMLEDRAGQVIDPDAATMLEIAQTLQGTLKADWTAGQRLQDGSRQLRYVESVAATAGQGGNLTLPPNFIIAVPLFRGGPVQQIRVAFRFRIGPPLSLQYKVLDSERLEREAFEAEVARVRQADSALTIILGPAPDETP